ncbi:MAG: hypothetical protein RLZZ297_48 [Chloroflexota bacterium]|jgi:hypothetical protein
MFDATQLATLRAIIDRFIPSDTSPGGLAAGVDDYLIRLLQGDGAGYLARYTDALTAVEREAHHRHATAFARLAASDADALLHDLWANQTQVAWVTDAAAFLRLCAEQCAEGFYADPRHGANAGAVSWQMLGFEERR